MLDSFIKNEAGSVAAPLVICSFAIIVALAAGADNTLWKSQQSKLQDAADSASISGAIMLGSGGRNVEKSSKAQARTFAEDVIERTLNGF
ncbi:pilus assembly protein TadG-related protein [Litorimonas sp. WD9-15]|uniref:pilus assembly protein TadG-related protein n=1 Tax=Litorimonas sp. WD9-15 TaxID=3418716 RepID=UPI003D016187